MKSIHIACIACSLISFRVAVVAENGPMEWVSPVVQAPGLEHRTFHSPAIGRDVSYHIWLPDAYRTEPDRRFPVLYWLHGGGGGGSSGKALINGVAPIARLFAQGVRDGKIDPVIIVFPNGLHSLWINSADGTIPMETIVIQELIPHIDATVRSIATREGRFLEGFSMGGYGAARFAFRYPDLFASASILAGGPLQPEFTHAPRTPEARRVQVLRDIFGGEQNYFIEQSPRKLAAEYAVSDGTPVRLRLVIGERDEMFEVKSDFHAYLQEIGIAHQWIAVPGVGHQPLPLIQALGDDFWTFHDISGASTLNARPLFPEAARQYHEMVGGETLIILQNGELVHESYANGGRPGRMQSLASGTKSFVGVAALAAVDDGLIDLDGRVCDALPEWADHPLKSRITYRQLLTLTSGLLAGERETLGNIPAWEEVIGKPIVSAPGTRFAYGAYPFIAFCEALQRLLGGESFEEYLQRRILDPIGVTLYWRGRCADGQPQVGGGGVMTARDWTLFGEFVRNAGQVNGESIIDATLFPELSKGTDANPAYGLTWWLKQEHDESLTRQQTGNLATAEWIPDDLFMAAGLGKQRLYIIPSMDLVVVRQGPLNAGRNFSDDAFLGALLQNRIEPAPHRAPARRRR